MHLARHAKTWRPLYLLAPLDLKHKNNLLKWAKQLKLGNGLSILADVLVGSFNDLGDILRNRRVLPPIQRIFMALTNIEPEASKDDAEKMSQRWRTLKTWRRQREDAADTTALRRNKIIRRHHDWNPNKINRRTRHWWLALDILVETLIASKMSSGINQLLQSAGVGSMRPNMLIMPLKVWKDFQEDSTNNMTP